MPIGEELSCDEIILDYPSLPGVELSYDEKF